MEHYSKQNSSHVYEYCKKTKKTIQKCPFNDSIKSENIPAVKMVQKRTKNQDRKEYAKCRILR